MNGPLAHPNFVIFFYWSKMTLKSSSYLLPKFISGPLTIGLILLIITIVNGTLLNFGKRYKDNLRAIFDQWPKLYLCLDALLNQRILKSVKYLSMYLLDSVTIDSAKTGYPVPSKGLKDLQEPRGYQLLLK